MTTTKEKSRPTEGMEGAARSEASTDGRGVRSALFSGIDIHGDHVEIHAGEVRS